MYIKNKTLKFAFAGTTGDYTTKVEINSYICKPFNDF